MSHAAFPPPRHLSLIHQSNFISDTNYVLRDIFSISDAFVVSFSVIYGIRADIHRHLTGKIPTSQVQTPFSSYAYFFSGIDTISIREYNIYVSNKINKRNVLIRMLTDLEAFR